MADDDLTLCDACSIELEAEGEKVTVEIGGNGVATRSRGMACYLCPVCIEIPLVLTVEYKSRGFTQQFLVDPHVGYVGVSPPGRKQ